MRPVPIRAVPRLESLEAVPWRSAAFRAAIDRARRFAPVRAPVLLCGETGAGKSAFAELVHVHGPGAEAPLLVVNCAALPATLLESELFGHVRGAFTGAETDRAGLLRAAGTGTVLLDEVDKAPRALQAALLHVLDRREVRPVGASRAHPVDARLVFATNRDPLPDPDVLLPDLWFRIGTLRVEVPPVRRRREDFPQLLSLATRRLAEEGLGSVSVTRDVAARLAGWRWPGNVRELFGVIRAAALLAEPVGRIDGAAVDAAAGRGPLAAHLARTEAGTDLAARVRAFEIDEILLALRVEGGHQGRAATRLGLSRRGLNKKLHRYDLLGVMAAEGLEPGSAPPAPPAPPAPREREQIEPLW
jgi:transcriptional regulator with GAF, ATPase, and Fis domain